MDGSVHKILLSHHQYCNYNDNDDDDDNLVSHYQYAYVTSIRPSSETAQET